MCSVPNKLLTRLRGPRTGAGPAGGRKIKSSDIHNSSSNGNQILLNKPPTCETVPDTYTRLLKYLKLNTESPAFPNAAIKCNTPLMLREGNRSTGRPENGRIQRNLSRIGPILALRTRETFTFLRRWEQYSHISIDEAV